MTFHAGCITWGRSADGRLVPVNAQPSLRGRVRSGLGRVQRERIVAAHRSGMSYSQIAREYDVSRNVIAGIIYRAGGPVQVERRRSPAPRAVEIIEPPIVAKVVEPGQPYVPAAIGFMDLRDNLCRWPLWKPDVPFSEKRYCGNAVMEGRPYCPHCNGLSVAPRRTESFDKKHGFFKLTKRGRR